MDRPQSPSLNLVCFRRRRYATEKAAMSIVYRLRASGIKGISASLCEKCGNWHVQQQR